MIHLAYISSVDWELFWHGGIGKDLKGTVDECDLLPGGQYFAPHAGRTITALTYVLTYLPPLVTIFIVIYRRNQSWHFNLITKCEIT